MGLVRDIRQELRDRLFERGVDPQRIQFIHRHEDKSTLMQTRMRNSQPRLLHHLVSVKQDIEIDRPWTRPIVVIPPKRAFDFLQGR